MKKLSIILAIATILALTALFSGCKNGADTEKNSSVASEIISEDVSEIISEEASEGAIYGKVRKGSIIKFGKYEQNNKKDDGAEPIEWKVLAVEDGKALIISKRTLDCKKYNETYEEVTWENCTVRSWLHEYFYNNAFDDLEKSMIISEDHDGVLDNVFFLSDDEAEKYFRTEEDRIACCTLYAIEQGAYGYIGYLSSYWWLRTSGEENSKNAKVVEYSNGDIGNNGFPVTYEQMTVRPALWLRVEV